ncbi:alpha/beta fold hydrolase [Paraburkholderia sp. NMBU_R16]|uniref:alpha/beta fold hydrolase n=1 Tax=Paraburkholderia sp. NMBU_R16 TaxID=2698676 RepID=UPI001564476C|nr:alpha/beta fold hydrolase [Paraburkholderia sp. NMBU_R16]NRO98432.1 alpha/beta fold hydrolase [Paraburkholderia sp. NMBU_R16]
MLNRALCAAAAVAACASAAYCAFRWRQLARAPAIDEVSRRSGIRGFSVQAGPFAMFSRLHPGPEGTADPVPVVLAHGLVVSSRYMEPLMLVLARWYRVYAPDLPGFGESRPRCGRRSATLSVEALAYALKRWMDACGLTRAIFIGNSFGCQILAEFATRFPEATLCLVMQGPTVDAHARSLRQQLWRAWVNGRREQARSPAALARIDYAKAGLRRAVAAIRLAIADRIEDRLPHVAVPTLIVYGSHDPLVPVARQSG